MQAQNEPAHSAEWTAFQYLRAEILSGRLPGGTVLRQEDIAAKLNLSRIPVRDALRRLATAGFVTFESNRRASVTLLRGEDLSELFQMRAVLEGLAARHAARNLTRDDIGRLVTLADRLEKTERAAKHWMPVHEEFHDLLCSRSGMPRLIGEIRRLRHQVEPYVRVLISLHGAAELSMSRHKGLIAAFRKKDPDYVEHIIREHILEASREIQATIALSPLENGQSIAEPVDKSVSARKHINKASSKKRVHT